jgi:hypothetical protein
MNFDAVIHAEKIKILYEKLRNIILSAQKFQRKYYDTKYFKCEFEPDDKFFLNT